MLLVLWIRESTTSINSPLDMVLLSKNSAISSYLSFHSISIPSTESLPLSLPGLKSSSRPGFIQLVRQTQLKLSSKSGDKGQTVYDAGMLMDYRDKLNALERRARKLKNKIDEAKPINNLFVLIKFMSYKFL